MQSRANGSGIRLHLLVSCYVCFNFHIQTKFFEVSVNNAGVLQKIECIAVAIAIVMFHFCMKLKTRFTSLWCNKRGRDKY